MSQSSAPPKIGLIVPGFSASETDWCIPAHLSLVRRLANRVELHLFPLRYPYHRDAYRIYAAAVHPLGGAQTRGLGRALLLRRAVAAVIAEHRYRPFDVLHAIWIDEPGFVVVSAGLLLGVPTVLSLAGGELVRLPDIGYGGQISRLNRALVWMALRRASRVTAGSSYLCQLARHHAASVRPWPIPIGVDTGLFCPESDRGDNSLLAGADINLLHVASLVPVKDQAMLLRAVSRVLQHMTGVHLHIVGDGPLRADLEALAASLGIGQHVTFHGAVPHEQMPAYYRAADLCVMSSRHEGQGLVILEAAACGRVTVGTVVGLLPDLVPATDAVPVGDDKALAEAVVAALQDPAMLAAAGRAACEAVQADYTLEGTVAQFLGLYAELTEPSRRATRR
jgi:glycosyltransferase involved in cell wall biosynthesis